MRKIKIQNKIARKHSVIGILLMSSLVVAGILFAQNDDHQAEAQAPNAAFTAETSPTTNSSTPSSTPSASASQPASAAAATAAKTSAPASSTPKPSTASSNNNFSSTATSSGLYADPTSQVAVDAKAWAVSNPGDATAMNYLASQPIAQWFGDWNADVASDVASYVSAAQAANKLPVLVAYDIPERDCSSYSAGGAASAADYTSWMQSFASGIGAHPAMVILEPDALASMDCLSSPDQQTRLQLIAAAVHLLKTTTDASVYIDAGNSDWQPASVMQTRLQAADVGEANGFSLNVSNFYTTSQNTAFGNQLSQLLGGKHFVIDTSRNGNGATSDSQWCNPAGRAVGQSPTLATGNSLIDAYLWVKAPGESDGSCGPSEAGSAAPAAGAWWPQYALSLLGL